MNGFLRLLRSNIPFFWDDYAQQYFDALKNALTSSPLISPPKFDRDFVLYISTSTYSIATVLIQDDATRIGHVIYYVCKTLTCHPMSYSHEEKLALDFVFLVQKLRHYILTRTTKVVTNSNPIDFLLIR